MSTRENDHAVRVGARIRALRAGRGLSLSALAGEAGIGKGSLSELETGRRNPTLDTLYAVAGPLGVPLSALLDEHSDPVLGDEGGLVATRLHVVREADRTTEVYLLHLPAGAERRSVAHPRGAVEQLVVLRGSGIVEHGGGRDQCGPGDHVRFPADRPHSYRAGDAEPLEAVNVIVTPAGP